MKKLVICQGLPASGKSQWAKEQVEADPGKVVRVSKDDIRAALKEKWNWKWSQENEAKDVIPARDTLITKGLNDPNIHTVISDDTNLQRVHKERLAQIAQECNAELVMRRFDTPVDICVRRDALRKGDEHVGEKVIRDMAKRYVNDYTSVVPYVAVLGGQSAIICDLDGTLADNSWRNPYDGSRCEHDPVIEPIRNIIEVFSMHRGHKIIYLSGRDGEFRPQTEAFLKKNHCPDGPLFMRKAGDKRKDWIVKNELFDANVRFKFNVKFVLDDRNQVVEMWRKLGLTCLQVADGNF